MSADYYVVSTLTVQNSTIAKGFAHRVLLRVVNWIKEEYRLTHYAHTRWKAEKGDALAQYNLAVMCETGGGVFQTSAEAIKWYQKAAFQGVAQAQLAIGLKYLHGEGMTKNDAEALLWLRKAAEQGQPEAQFLIGELYREGRGTPRDLLQASKWYRKAADRGHATAKRQFKELNSTTLGSYEIQSPPPQDERLAA